MSIPSRCGRRRTPCASARRFTVPSSDLPADTGIAGSRVAPLAAALVLAFGTFGASGAHAQATPGVAAAGDARRLDPVTVTATRTESRVSETVAEVTVLDREDIDRASPQPLSEFLARQPGLQVSSNGGWGRTSGVFIRGLEARHTLLLVDGVRVGSATVGTPSFDNLPLAIVDRIEIVRGPMSSLYGSDAAGGVVQLFTRRAGPGLRPDAFATIGTHRFAQLGGGFGFGADRFDGAVRIAHTGTRGESATTPSVRFGQYNPDLDGFRQTAGSARLGWQLSPDWRVEGLAIESHGETDYDDGPGGPARAKLRNGIQALSTTGRLASNWNTRLIYGRSTDVYDTVETASPFNPLGATRTTQTQLTWENTFATRAGRLLALAERIEQDVERPGDPYTVGSRSINAAALGLAGEAGAHAWQAGARHDSNSQFGGRTTGSLGYGFALTPTWRVGASYGTSFVAPSFNQLYFPGFGTPTLQPEEGRHGELSVRWSSGGRTLRAAWVDNRIQGYIPSGPLPVNVPRTRIDGLVLSWEGRFAGLVTGASYERLDPRNVTEGANYGKQLPRRAKDAFRAQADWLFGQYGIGATVSAFSGRYEDQANTLRMGGFATVDLRADWRYDRDWTVGLRLDNLADKQYETSYGYNTLGRATYVTVRWDPK
jgi:vitamin B12 transporter